VKAGDHPVTLTAGRQMIKARPSQYSTIHLLISLIEKSVKLVLCQVIPVISHRYNYASSLSPFVVSKAAAEMSQEQIFSLLLWNGSWPFPLKI
jgi:hypothetical protein